MSRPEFAPEERRDFMKTIAKQTLGVSFAGTVASQGLFGEAQAAPIVGKAKHIIYLFMDGAMYFGQDRLDFVDEALLRS